MRPAQSFRVEARGLEDPGLMGLMTPGLRGHAQSTARVAPHSAGEVAHGDEALAVVGEQDGTERGLAATTEVRDLTWQIIRQRPSTLSIAIL